MKNRFFLKTITLGMYIILMLSFISCGNSKPQYNVNFFFPEAKTNNQLMTFIYDYGLRERGIPVSADSLLVMTDNLQKKYLGGVSVNGTMTIDDEFIEFTPGMMSSVSFDDIKSFRIPYSDIDSVKSEPFLIMMKAIVVNTKKGAFKFQLTRAKNWYNPFKFSDEDICNLLKEKI